MKKPPHGPSIYYATDKNVFDALNQHRVDQATIRQLFADRNVLVSKHTDKSELARYFSRLVHDYQDHQRIAARLGVANRREKMTAVEIATPIDVNQIETAISAIKVELEKDGDVVLVTRDGDDIALVVQYSEVDYAKTEFKQVQHKDGVIHFKKEDDAYIVRNSQNEYINKVRDAVFSSVEKRNSIKLDRRVVSLYDVVLPSLRSEFFYNLIHSIEGMGKYDVTELYVYRSTPEEADDDEQELSDDDAGNHEVQDSRIERIALRGKGVEQSQELKDIISKSADFYTIRTVWKVREAMGEGHVFELDAHFANARDCTGFSYLVRGVYPCEDGMISKKRRSPRADEVERLSSLIEKASKKCADDIWAKSTSAKT
ncbi:hypothetical protein [Burkholderia multivorans]|uniref:hypothetical protein n=1 Tax=Burkholderia multivorans TaxID=87883 RepID=UPI000F513ABC|nr:hypothetical protein [Burkholderia multivorans]MCA8440643.1 hypothetical protein [Burkholderia multivorans]